MKINFLFALFLSMFLINYGIFFAWFFFSIDRIFQIDLSNQVDYFCNLNKQSHSALSLNELYYNNMTDKEFKKLYFEYKPFVIRNFTTRTTLTNWSPSYFTDMIKEPQMSTNIGIMKGSSGKANYNYNNFKKILDPKNNYYLPVNNHIIIQHPNLFLEYQNILDSLLQNVNRTIVNVDIFISNTEKDSGTGSHWHAAHGTNAFIQAKGTKTWTLLEPAATICMKPYWKLNEDALWTRYTVKQLNKKIPYFPYPYFKVTLYEGDLLINPSYWWHSVQNNKGFVVGIANRLIQWHGNITTNYKNDDNMQQPYLTFLYGLFTQQKTLLGKYADKLYFWQSLSVF